METLSERDWQIRHYVYSFFVLHAQPPTSDRVAKQFGLLSQDGEEA